MNNTLVLSIAFIFMLLLQLLTLPLNLLLLFTQCLLKKTKPPPLPPPLMFLVGKLVHSKSVIQYSFAQTTTLSSVWKQSYIFEQQMSGILLMDQKNNLSGTLIGIGFVRTTRLAQYLFSLYPKNLRESLVITLMLLSFGRL